MCAGVSLGCLVALFFAQNAMVVRSLATSAFVFALIYLLSALEAARREEEDQLEPVRQGASPAARQRLSVRPGPATAPFLLACGLVVIVGLYARSNLLYWMLGFMLGLAVASIMLGWLNLRGVRITRRPPRRLVASRPGVVIYDIVNPRRLIPLLGLTVEEAPRHGRGGPAWAWNRPRGWVAVVPQSGQAAIEAICWPKRRGEFAFEAIRASSGWPLGLFQFSIRITSVDPIVIFPPVLSMPSHAVAQMVDQPQRGRRHVDRPGGHEDFWGLRDYREGDSLKLIDWRRTARTGELVTRELTPPTPPKVIVLLDLSDAEPISAQAEQARLTELTALAREGGAAERRQAALAERGLITDEEKTIALAASVISAIEARGVDVGLVTVGAWAPVVPPGHGMLHRDRILTELAKLNLSNPSSTRKSEDFRSLAPQLIVRIRDEQPAGAIPLLVGSRLDSYVDEPMLDRDPQADAEGQPSSIREAPQRQRSAALTSTAGA